MRVFFLVIALNFFACAPKNKETKKSEFTNQITAPTLVVLGTLQDGGSPHAGCKKQCCEKLFKNPDVKRQVVSLGLIDPQNKNTWLFEATPDLPKQIKELKELSALSEESPTGIFITHAHIGHYSGLMYLGREAMNATKVPVYAMPRMKKYLEENGPWSQLVKLENIRFNEIKEGAELNLANTFTVVPFTVPHRDEFSETVGYQIKGPNKKVLFIPDIDKWEKWNNNIINEIRKVDYAFIDGTFYDGNEVNNRNIKEIPHPFVIESMNLFKDLSKEEKSKIYFIHFNHTNPLLDVGSKAFIQVQKEGFNIAQKNLLLKL